MCVRSYVGAPFKTTSKLLPASLLTRTVVLTDTKGKRVPERGQRPIWTQNAPVTYILAHAQWTGVRDLPEVVGNVPDGLEAEGKAVFP